MVNECTAAQRPGLSDELTLYLYWCVIGPPVSIRYMRPSLEQSIQRLAQCSISNDAKVISETSCWHMACSM